MRRPYAAWEYSSNLAVSRRVELTFGGLHCGATQRTGGEGGVLDVSQQNHGTDHVGMISTRSRQPQLLRQ